MTPHRRESDPRFPAALAFFVTALLVGSGIVVFAWRADAADTCVTVAEARSVVVGDLVTPTLNAIAPDHGQVRYHSPTVRDVSGCHWRTDVWRFRFDRTSHGRQIVGWRWIHCTLPSECVTVEHSGRATRG